MALFAHGLVLVSNSFKPFRDTYTSLVDVYLSVVVFKV